MPWKFSVLAAVLVLLIGVVTAPNQPSAHAGATGIVKERMDAMEVIKDAAKALKGGLVDGNGAAPEAMRAEAQKISDRAGEALLRLYPEGSRTGVTEAKAEIWTDWERFAELAHLFKARADAVVAEPTKATFVPLAQTCKTCHEDFKAED